MWGSHKGKMETGVPANGSGQNSSDLSIGMRGSGQISKETVVVDKKILEAEVIIMDQLIMNI